MVNKVPLQAGANTLTVALTTLTGKTVTASLVVTSLGNPSVLELQPSTTSGIAPLTVSFNYQLHTTSTVSKMAMDFNSDGSNDFITTNPEAVLQYNYTTPGLYVATLTVTDNQGTVFMAKTAIQVLGMADMDRLIVSLWDQMNQALIAGDKAGALRFLTPRAQRQYAPVFEALLPHMSEMVASYSPLQRVSWSNNIGEFAVNRTIHGQLRIFLIYYLQDASGVWRLETM